MSRILLVIFLTGASAGCDGYRPLSLESEAPDEDEGESLDDPMNPPDIETPPGEPVSRVPLGTFAVNAATTALSQTGLFRDLQGLVPANGLIEYDVNVALFSDDAKKRRWMAIPSEGQIVFSPAGRWVFPNGTILIKHFEIPDAPNRFRKLETRLWVNNGGNWNSFMFIWNAAQTDATISTANSNATISYFDAETGLTTTRTWTFPGGQCLRCHVNQSGTVLGVNTLQLNRDLASANQLTTLNNESFFSVDIGAGDLYDSLPRLEDNTQPLERRAKAYLGVNCSHCHQPGGPNAFIDFRFVTPLAGMNLVGVTGNAGITRITPGSKENSLVYRRILTAVPGAGTGRMPPVGRSVTHDVAVDLIGSWIDGM